MIVQFKKEVIFPKNIGKFQSGSFGFLDIAALNRDINFAFQTRAHPNQSGAMPGQYFFVDARFIMKSIQMRSRNQLYQIAITDEIFGQQRKMKRRISSRGCASIIHSAGRHVHLASNNRFDPGLLSHLIKLDRTVHVAVVGNGDCRHTEFSCFPY